MTLRTRVSKANRFTATAIIAMGMLCALAGTRPALAGVATGKIAFNSGDYTTAMREFQGPAYRGDALAQYYMGVIYADGLGVSRSDDESLAWLMCVRTGSLPWDLRGDLHWRRARISSRISSYTLEQAELRAGSICGKAIAPKKRAFTTNEIYIEEIGTARGFWGKMFFFPGDTMVIGAVVVFQELGFTLLSDIVVAIARLMRDLLFGILSLIGWVIIGKLTLFLVKPVWKVMMVR